MIPFEASSFIDSKTMSVYLWLLFLDETQGEFLKNEDIQWLEDGLFFLILGKVDRKSNKNAFDWLLQKLSNNG